ncbi:MAG: hypothetical protein P4L57_11955 [Rhizomicrobium sp.]|nr:hypothetical protein [Rhizomicrobium sp.]
MSGNKDCMAAVGTLRGQARQVMRRAGVLDYCEDHDAYFDTWADIEQAYRLGNALVTRGEIDLRGFNRRDFTDAMKNELKSNMTLGGCVYCEHARVA